MNSALPQSSAFVTGATGMIGGALVKTLSQSGFRTVALARDLSRAGCLKEVAGIEWVVGDLSSSERLAHAMRGCDTVFHLAAKVHSPPIPNKSEEESEFFRVNVEGTRNVIEAAIASGVARFVFFSTVAVYPDSEAELDEDSAPAPATAYGASKLAAEKIVLERAAANGMKAAVLRLPVVYGPRDRGNVARLIEAIRRRRYFIVGNGANFKSMVAVGNVVDAAMLVANDERSRGRIYIVCDERAYTQREISETIAGALGISPNFLRLPRGVAMFLGQVADFASDLIGLSLPISVDRIRKLSSNTRYSAAKIERELGFQPRVTLREGLIEIIDNVAQDRNR
jgi:nucleoside-diphosphate-sugar epimerase